jgi:phytoene dehydrogenase-like protein
VLLGTRTVRIQTSEGGASGIVVERGGSVETLPADVVISNAGPLGTLSLAGDANFDRSYLDGVRNRVRPTPIVVSYVVSDQPLFTARSAILAAGLERIVTAVPLTNICPEWAPDGRHLMSFYATPKSCLQPLDHEDEIRANTADIHAMFPALEARGGRILDIQVRDIDDEDVVARSWPGYGVPVETTIPNLFNVGDACGPPGFIATPAAAMSARLAVDRILASREN